MSKHICPVCGNDHEIFALCNVNGYSIYGCKTCGADHVFPQPESSLLKAYYDRPEWFEGGEVGGYQNYDQQTTWSVNAIKSILDEFEGVQGLSVLDVGCGYGAHLDLAASLGWKCFGVEMSDHARQVAQERLEGKAYIVESVADLIPHEFDLVLMLDVIEHLPSPYALFYSLFSIGAITPKTRIVISTPNAGSEEARRSPAEWAYRHPPSHLVYYSAESLRHMLERLHFSGIQVQGVHPIEQSHPASDDMTAYGGLLATASGSDFTEFMRERYVPGTWSKLAEYEHFPRYELAKESVSGKTVLDFGCGTGYGSAILSQVAANVTGLDIDEAAISWATQTHNNPKLTFHRCSDMGATLPGQSFDVVTCFEMIEHVDYTTQQAAIASIARLLREDGVLIISTPNPEITKLYGANPYHLREMNLSEFHELLAVHFPHVLTLEQRVRNSITFDQLSVSRTKHTLSLGKDESGVMPLAFVAYCSRQPLQDIHSRVMFDEEVDLIQETLSREKKLNAARFDGYTLNEAVHEQIAKVKALETTVVDYQASSEEYQTLLHKCGLEEQRLNEMLEAKAAEEQRLNEMLEARSTEIQNKIKELQNKTEEIQRVYQSKWYRLGVAINSRPVTLHTMAKVIYLMTSLITPLSWRQKLAPLITKWRQRRSNEHLHQPSAQQVTNDNTYFVRQTLPAIENRPRVIHVIANFRTGGSSRLVTDLIEHLGPNYEQSVFTSFIPTPPAYVGLDISECRFPADEKPFIDHFSKIKPDLIHIHYWGDCDESWYAKAFKAAEQLEIPVIQNINTPIAPYVSRSVARYVYVSNYVRQVFGKEDPSHLTIYPGSDLDHFVQPEQAPQSENCVGMVYRLEHDKLNEQSILPFIRIVQRRPQTRVLIVGGGSLLIPFQQAVELAGVKESFEFTDYISYQRLPEYYRRMSLFVAPIWKESFGQVSAFAMNMRIPVIGYDTGAISEILDDPQLLAPPADHEKLAEIAISLLDSAEKRADIGQKQHERAQLHFSVQAMTRAYANLYAEVGQTSRRTVI